LITVPSSVKFIPKPRSFTLPLTEVSYCPFFAGHGFIRTEDEHETVIVWQKMGGGKGEMTVREAGKKGGHKGGEKPPRRTATSFMRR
jgi:hypothetical protein